MIRIAAVGSASTGKSAVLNAVFGTAFPVDARSGTTHSAARSVVGEVEVIDAPPDQLVPADAYLLVCDKDLTESEMAHLQRMRGRPVAIVLNKSDTYDAAQLDGLLNHIRTRVRGLVQPDRVLACAADPVRIVHRERTDGSVSEHVVPAQADIAAILEAVQDLITAAGSSVRVRSRELAGRLANALKHQQWMIMLCLCAAAGWAKEPARPKIVGVSHLAVYAKDLEQSRGFYRDFLGYEHATVGQTAYFRINGRQFLKVLPEREGGTDRLSHISLETDDVNAMRAYLLARGVAAPEKVTKDELGNSVLKVKDPEGHTVEFVQYRHNNLLVTRMPKHLTPGGVSKRLMHVGIIVTALEPEMKFYTDVLGFREFWRGSSNGKELSWINLRLPDSEDYIELMLYKLAPAPTARGSAHHQCLEVSDIEAALAALEAKPNRKQYTRTLEVRTGRNRRRQLNLFDPDGTRTELMEPVTVDGQPAPSSDAPPPH